MGTFRFILALAVLLAHMAENISGSMVNRQSLHILVWSGNAVFAFFIISGFYMSLVINEKYAKLPNGTKRFYLNRALRLYPIHWTVLAIYVAAYFVSGLPSFWTGHYREPLWRWLYAILSNIFLFGSEVLPFFDEANTRFVVGPIWSLSIEWYFYLLAPFIVGRTLRTLLVLCGLAFAFRMTLFLSDLPVHPWRYFFFPANLVLFLMGSLSYRLYIALKGVPVAKWLGAGAAALLLACVVSPVLWTARDVDSPQSWLFYVCAAIGTPLLFNLTKNWKLDNFLGHLSYPIFLSHVLVISVVKRLDLPDVDKGVVALVATIAFSAALYASIDRPVERIRKRVGVA